MRISPILSSFTFRFSLSPLFFFFTNRYSIFSATMASTDPNNPATFLSSRRPWSDLLDLSALDLPSSLDAAKFRISVNLAHFRFNYAAVLLLVLLLSLFYRPLSVLSLSLLLAAWYFLFFSRDDPPVLFNFVLDDHIMLVVLGISTLVVLILCHVWLNVFASVVIGGFLVCSHAALRIADDQESPYGALLSDADHPMGAYSSM